MFTMPGCLIERPKMTRTMYQALKRHIMKEREKKKQEQEQDAALERMKKEKEMKKKKEEEDSLTLEQTKEQIAQLETKMESLKAEKHELFSQLKKVLHHEDETRRRAQMKEQSELLQLSQQYPQSMPLTTHHPMFLQGGHMHGRPTMFRPSQQQQQQQQPQPVMAGMKRQRSPSPPPVSLYQHYPESAASAAKYPAASYATKHGTYPVTQASHVTYVTQSAHYAQQQQQQPVYTVSQSGGGKYPANQSAFSSYPSHYAHQQKQITDHYPQGYPVQRMQQPGYMQGSPHAGSTLPLQQQLEHANQKSGFNEEKFKMQQQAPTSRGMASLPPNQQQAMMQQQIQLQQQQQQQKGSIVTGYPVRGQNPAPTSSYQPTTTSYPAQSSSYQTTTTMHQPPTSQTYTSQPSSAPRHTYGNQPPGRYY